MPRRSELLIYAILIGLGLVLSSIFKQPSELSVPRFEGQSGPAPPRVEHLRPGYRATVPEMPQRGRHDLISLGTAFAVNSTGDWATARHVSQDCAAMAVLEPGGTRGYPVRLVVNHPHTDLSLLVTDGSFDSLAIADRDPGRNETGFFVGYPQGDPASVEASYLGRDDIDIIDEERPGGREERIQGDFWVETRRAPPFQGSLGGLSGGPVLDAAGAVIGVTVAEEPRRGRVVSIAPESLTELLHGAASEGWSMDDERSGEAQGVVNDANFARYGDALRAESSVAEVYCYGFRQGIQQRRPRF